METGNIELFLQKFSDQNLANLQAAAEDGRLEYWEPCRCLVGHHQGDYERTKRESIEGGWLSVAGMAEREFWLLGLPGLARPDCCCDAIRCQTILPLISAEWERRAPKPAVAEALEAVGA